MIGTVLKVGFDATAVKTGLHGVAGMMGRIGRQFGIGAVRRGGEAMTDLFGRILQYIPQMVSETLDWEGELVDLSRSLDMPIEKLVQLQEALRLGGSNFDDPTRMLAKFSQAVWDAAEGGSAMEPIAKLFERTGMAHELKQMPLDQIMSRFGDAIQNSKRPMTELQAIMGDIIGGKVSSKMMKVFTDWAASTKQARNNTEGLSASMKTLAPSAEAIGDAIGRWTNVKRSVGSIIIDEAGKLFGGAGGIDKMFDSFDPEKLRPKIANVLGFVSTSIKGFFSQDISKSFGDFFRNIGMKIGEGIAETLKPIMPTGKGLLKSLFTSNGTPAANDEETLPELERHTALLKAIKDNVGTAKFA